MIAKSATKGSGFGRQFLSPDGEAASDERRGADSDLLDLWSTDLAPLTLPQLTPIAAEALLERHASVARTSRVMD